MLGMSTVPVLHKGMIAVHTGECALRDSGKSFTIVRPGHLVNEAGGQHKLVTGKWSKLLEPRKFARTPEVLMLLTLLSSLCCTMSGWQLLRRVEAAGKHAAACRLLSWNPTTNPGGKSKRETESIDSWLQ